MSMKIREAVRNLKSLGVPVSGEPYAFGDLTKVSANKYSTPIGKIEDIENKDEIHISTSMDALTDKFKMTLDDVPLTGVLFQIGNGFLRYYIEGSEVACATEGVPEEYEKRIEEVNKKLGISERSFI
jgi:hypothetical protein